MQNRQFLPKFLSQNAPVILKILVQLNEDNCHFPFIFCLTRSKAAFASNIPFFFATL